jgi:hypothetical protein
VRPAIDDLVHQARAHYERAMQAQRDGNWALYGEEIKRLGEVLERIAAQAVIRVYRLRYRTSIHTSPGRTAATSCFVLR